MIFEDDILFHKNINETVLTQQLLLLMHAAVDEHRIFTNDESFKISSLIKNTFPSWYFKRNNASQYFSTVFSKIRDNVPEINKEQYDAWLTDFKSFLEEVIQGAIRKPVNIEYNGGKTLVYSNFYQLPKKNTLESYSIKLNKINLI